MITITGHILTIHDVARVAIDRETVELDEQALQRAREAHERITEWGMDQRPMYGVNTGFGEMAHVTVPARYMSELQVNLLRGCAAGCSEVFDEPEARAILLARLNCLARGYSGVSTETLSLMADLLNRGITPVIPKQGSLGASGDLSPLSHMGLPLIGEGEVFFGGERVPSMDALQANGLKPVVLGYKEGLALNNGTSAMTGVAAIALLEAHDLLENAVLLASVVIQCLRGSAAAYDALGHELKGHPGQIQIAERLRSLLTGSRLTRRHAELMTAIEQQTGDDDAVTDTGIYIQNAYSLRCVPQILGPVVETIAFCRGIVERELNSCNDNPLVFASADTSFHGGNFHGQYVAMACDYLAIALTEIGVLAERQLNRLVDPATSGELPDFLALTDSGLSFGLMGVQFLATSVASENLDLAAPSSVKTIPSNGQNQDVVSMGLNAARRCLQLSANVSTILGVLGAACYQSAHILGAEQFSEPGRQWFAHTSQTVGPHDETIPVSAMLSGARSSLLSQEGAELAHKYVNLA